MRDRSFVEHHLREALRGAAAEADGDEELSRRLHAETKLRLIEDVRFKRQGQDNADISHR